MHTRVLAVSLGLVSITAVACSRDQSHPAGFASTTPSSSQGMSGMDHGTTFAFGVPADMSDADRTVEIIQLDTLRFDPASIDVEVGETITFEVTNAGQTVHEFALGDAAMQGQHEGEMGDTGGSMMADEVNAVSLDPSEKKSLTWTFTEPGTVLYACHVDGHYAGGMVGQIRVDNG